MTSHTVPSRVALTALALALPALHAQDPTPIRDPIRDYLNHFETQPDEQLISSQIDLNGDGIDEVFLSRNSLYNGRQGNIWVLYESLPDGSWRRHDTLGGEDSGVIEFHPKAVSVQSDGRGGKQLIRYSPGSSSSGRLTTFQLRGGTVTETLRPGDILPGETHASLFDRYFSNPETQLSFHLEDMAALRAQYLPFNGWFREITAGKLIFLGLCLFVPLWLLRGLFRLVFGSRPRTS